MERLILIIMLMLISVGGVDGVVGAGGVGETGGSVAMVGDGVVSTGAGVSEVGGAAVGDAVVAPSVGSAVAVTGAGVSGVTGARTGAAEGSGVTGAEVTVTGADVGSGVTGAGVTTDPSLGIELGRSDGMTDATAKVGADVGNASQNSGSGSPRDEKTVHPADCPTSRTGYVLQLFVYVMMYTLMIESPFVLVPRMLSCRARGKSTSL
mmetsp:Transcript_34901/g.84444  ORF Transcript_34901/g.84444 Transcript_34901/m.84444 type:complete len:208 (+) Transcript_34901:427-1050(+)